MINDEMIQEFNDEIWICDFVIYNLLTLSIINIKQKQMSNQKEEDPVAFILNSEIKNALSQGFTEIYKAKP